MHVLFILIIVLVGGGVIVSAVSIPFSSKHSGRSRRCLVVIASTLMVVGAAGFFGSALSAVGGLNWLPESFEWPVGYVDGVVVTDEGFRIVPHTPSGRIQLYDADWRFIRGWHVDAGGGTFKVIVPEAKRIEVVTARGQRRYIFDHDGTLISKNTYSPTSWGSFPDQGEATMVPTTLWLWTFSHPLISWVTAAIGMGVLIFVNKAVRAADSGVS